MKFRILRKKVYISGSAQRGWGMKDSIIHEKDIIQSWDDKLGWVDLPVVIDSHDVYKNKMELSNY